MKAFTKLLANCFGIFLVIFYIALILFKPKDIKDIKSTGFVITLGTDWINLLLLLAIISYFGFVFSLTTQKKPLKYIVFIVSLILIPYVVSNL